MTVRFKCQSEYQKSYGAPRSRSVSPQRSAPLAGLRSDQMGISSEPGLQRRKRLSAGGLAQSCSSLLCPSDHLAELTPDAHRNAPPAAASRSRSSQRKKPSLEPKPLTPPGSRAEPGFQTGPETAAGPRPAADKGSPSRPRPARDPGPSAESRPAADPGPPAGPRPARDPGPSGEPVALGKSVKPHPSQPDSQSQPSHPLTAAPDGQQPLANAGERALRWRAGLRSGDQRSEYHRQFNWKKPAAAASPILTAEQVMFSSSRSVPPYKKNPVPMETEYQRSFQGLVPPSGSWLCKHLEHQRVPLFHTYMTHKRRRKESQKKPRHKQDAPQRDNTRSPHPPAQVQRGHRILTEYESSFRSPLYSIPEEGRAMDASTSQVKELRQAALSYRRRAWGTNFSRDHLSQLQSEHNALWEPMDNTDSASDPPTPRLTFDLGRDQDSRSTSCVEALDLTSRSSNSSKRSSVAGPGEVHHTNQSAAGDMHTKAQTPANPPAERRMAWEEEEEEEEATDEEEGRLPTPSLKMRPVQRTHHDITTPATGGAILVGKLKSGDDSSSYKQQRSGSAVSMAVRTDAEAGVPIRRQGVWPDNNPTHVSSSDPSPDHKPASKPTKQTAPPLVAPPPPVSPLQHCIQGTLRHPEFQHNGELGLRIRELQCSGGGCGFDEDDQLSVMSWRSAASCSMASAVLERAQKRREKFWGKR